MSVKAKSGASRKISAVKLRLSGNLLLKRLRGLPGRCSGTMERRRFRNALRDVGVKNIEDYLEWARKRGGYCDCEVVLNALRGCL